ncbi:hypothetical protein [uncultured Nostoc sp.]|nr:hypothetical protein [uncultured Nostoc sp.]
MDYPVEASHPPITRFRLNESHFYEALTSVGGGSPEFLYAVNHNEPRLGD